MKIRLFAKKFRIYEYVPLKSYTAKVYSNVLKVYDKKRDYNYEFTKASVFNLEHSSKIRVKGHIYDTFNVKFDEDGYCIGCCFVTHKQLQDIRKEFNYKSIF
jgi:hypothetical protein